jgi:hypothetical protein
MVKKNAHLLMRMELELMSYPTIKVDFLDFCSKASSLSRNRGTPSFSKRITLVSVLRLFARIAASISLLDASKLMVRLAISPLSLNQSLYRFTRARATGFKLKAEKINFFLIHPRPRNGFMKIKYKQNVCPTVSGDKSGSKTGHSCLPLRLDDGE